MLKIHDYLYLMIEDGDVETHLGGGGIATSLGGHRLNGVQRC